MITKISDLDYTAPIVPGESIGGMKLGLNFDEAAEGLDLGKGDDSWATEILYFSPNRLMAFGVAPKTRTIIRLSAMIGYQGLLLNKYKTGMPIDLLLDDPDWYFSEMNESVNSRTHEGVFATIDLEDPRPDELPGKEIFQIGVHIFYGENSGLR